MKILLPIFLLTGLSFSVAAQTNKPASTGAGVSSPQGTSAASPRKAREMAYEGNRLYDENQFSEAEIYFRKALEADQSMAEGAFNLGNSTYQQKRFEEAAARFGEVGSRTDLPAATRAEAYYNQGNAWYEAADYNKAISSYKQSLRLKPGDEDAKHNLSLSQKMLQQQQEQQQQNQEQQKQDQQQQDQQQQNQDQQQKQDQQQDEGQPKQEPQNQNQEKQDQQDGEKMRNMSPEELERVLEALEQDEKDVQKKVNAQKVRGVRVETEKDW